MHSANRSFQIIALTFGLAVSAQAQYSSNFEALTASAAGTLVTGQDGYYIPAGTTSVDFNVHTYAGNALGVVANPTGGANFIAGNGPAGGAFARAQRDITYGSGVWTAGYDICALFSGTLPTAQNLGSFSIQPTTTNQSFIALARWTDINVAMTWSADYVWFDAAGLQLTEIVNNAGFQNLPVNKWYRWETDFDLTTNEIVQVRLTDLATNVTVSENPVMRYMAGGTAALGPPTAFRFFAGGGIAGNILAFDNPSIAPAGPAQLGTRYCTPAVPNSTGASTRIVATGSAVVLDNDVTLHASSMPNNSFGFFLTSATQGLVMMPGGSQGNLCLSGAIGRYVGAGQIQNSGGTGGFQYMINLSQHPTPTGLVQVAAGQTWNFTCWHRDSVGGVATSNFADAVSILFL